MDNFYQPTDPGSIDKQNQHWRTKANYDEVQSLYFDLLNLDLAKVRADYVKCWQNQAARNFRTREWDRDDGKYPWIGIDPVYDNKRSYKQAHLLNLSEALPTSQLAIPFSYVGRLIRQGTVLFRMRRVPKLILPIPIPAERARQIMEQEWKQVQKNWFSRHEVGKEQAVNLRAYLAEKLIHSNSIVINGAQFYHIINYKSGDVSRPHQVGWLLGSIDYFKLCWREFHEAEQGSTTVIEPAKALSTDYPVSSTEVLLIGKYYPKVGKHLLVKTLSQLAAEWYSDLAVLGSGRIDHYTTLPYEAASNKSEFLACLNILLTEAEKYSHLRGYGYRQHFAPSDLTPSREAQLEISGNTALRAVRNWHTEASLPPIERFVHRACKIELWQNEQHQLTTLGLDDEDWRGIYNKLFIDLRRALYHTDESILRTAYTELGLLLPTLHTRWMARLDESTDEEDTASNRFSPTDLADHLPYCEFVPLQPLSIVSTQRDVCLMAWLMTHINVKEWYVWQALKLLAGRLKEPKPETPDSFRPQPPKPPDLTADQILTSELFSLPDTKGLSYLAAERLAPLLLNYTEEALAALLIELGLLDAGTKQAAPAASPGAWVGIIHALLEAEPPRARDNKAALGRALREVFGADLKERTSQAGLGKNGSEAEKVRDRALTILRRG